MSPDTNGLFIGTAPQGFNSGPGFMARVRANNFGKSPAIHVFSSGEIFTGDTYNDLIKQADAWFAQAGIPLHKILDNQTGFYKLPIGLAIPEMDAIMQGTHGDFTAWQLKGIPKPPARFVDRIEYRDMAGNLYWTDICYELGAQVGGGVLPSPCTTHNEVH